MSSNNKHNELYQKNEKKILNGYLSELKRVGADGERITLKGIAEASGLPYRTVLGHYKNFAELERSNIITTIRIACNIVDKSRLLGDNGEDFISRLLSEMGRKSVHFEIEYLRGNFIAWERILLYARDILTQGWMFYGKETDDIIFHRFCAEFIGDIYLWGKSGFSTWEFERHTLFLSYLVKQATNRELLI